MAAGDASRHGRRRLPIAGRLRWPHEGAAGGQPGGHHDLAPRTREVLARALDSELKLEVAETSAPRPRRRAGPAGPAATGSTWSSRSAATAPSTRSSTGCSPTARTPTLPALAVVPGGGTNVFARALGHARATRSRPPARSSTRCATGRRRSDRARPGRRALVHLQRRPRAGTPRWWPGRRARRRGRPSSDTRHARLRPGRAARILPARATAGTPALTAGGAGRGAGRAGLHLAIVANTAPWTYLGTGRCSTVARQASFDTGLDLFAPAQLRTVRTLRQVRQLLRGAVDPPARPRRCIARTTWPS